MLADNIKTARLAAHYTQTELGDKLGVTKQNISRYEKGLIENIPYDKIVGIASACQVSVEWLLGWNEKAVINSSRNEIKKGVFGTADGITDEMLDEVLSYAKYIKVKYSAAK